MIKLGKYRHFKGNYYQVLSIARHSETLEEMVVYQAQYNSEEWGDKVIWVRPLALFTDFKEVDGKTVPRFEYIGD